MAFESPLTGFDQLHQHASRLAIHLTHLQPQAGSDAATSAGVLQEAIEGYSNAIEELRVAESELRRQSDELSESYGIIEAERQRYHDLFEFAPDPYFVTDTEGRVREANRATTRLLSHARKYIYGKPLTILIDAADGHRFRTHLAELTRLAGEWMRTGEARLRPGRGAAAVIVQYHVAPVRDRGGVLTGLRWLFRDVTRERSTEERLHSLTAELERRVRERTAQLEAVTQVSTASLAYEQTARAEAENALHALQSQIVRVAAEAEGVLGALAAQDTAVAALLEQLRRTAAEPPRLTPLLAH